MMRMSLNRLCSLLVCVSVCEFCIIPISHSIYMHVCICMYVCMYVCICFLQLSMMMKNWKNQVLSVASSHEEVSFCLPIIQAFSMIFVILILIFVQLHFFVFYLYVFVM